MSKFVEFNVLGVPEQGVDHIFCEPFDICVCCLTQSVPFINLNSCKHAVDCNIFANFKIRHPSKLICGQCHSILIRFSKFNKQVERSVQFLNDQSYPYKPKKMLNLVQTPIEITWAYNSEPLKIKLEVENNSDGENIDYPDNITEAPGFPTNHVSAWDNVGLKFEELGSDNALTNLTAQCSKDIAYFDVKVKMEHGGEECTGFLDEGEAEVSNKKTKKVTSELPLKYDGKVRVAKLTKKEYYADKQMEREKRSFSTLPFKCDLCVVAFDHEINLNEHNEKKHTKTDGKMECEMCKSYFSSRHSYLDHYTRHFRRYECVLCSKRYTTLPAAAEHYKRQHGGLAAVYTCQLCQYTTDSNRRYRYHRQKHREKEQCALCCKTFTTKSGLKVHVLTKHSGVAPKANDVRFSCKACSKVYRTKTGLKHHNASVHEQKGAYCVTCKLHFRTNTIYLNHLATNSKHVSNKHPCEKCDATFVRRAALLHHIKFVHLKTVAHPCDKCGKVFPFATTLRRHTESVHDKKQKPRNKICDHCGKGFATLSVLRAHVRTHTGERPLRCAHCAAAFAHPAALYNHTKARHRVHPHPRALQPLQPAHQPPLPLAQ